MMHQISKADQLALTGPLPRRSENRYYTEEIAQFLNINLRFLLKWARSQGLLHECRGKNRVGRGWARIRWLTELGMARCVAHFRAEQGLKLMRRKRMEWNGQVIRF